MQSGQPLTVQHSDVGVSSEEADLVPHPTGEHWDMPQGGKPEDPDEPGTAPQDLHWAPKPPFPVMHNPRSSFPWENRSKIHKAYGHHVVSGRVGECAVVHPSTTGHQHKSLGSEKAGQCPLDVIRGEYGRT